MSEEQSSTEKLAALIREKRALGLSAEQARTVAEAQIAHDEKLTAAEKKLAPKIKGTPADDQGKTPAAPPADDSAKGSGGTGKKKTDAPKSAASTAGKGKGDEGTEGTSANDKTEAPK